MLKEGNTENTMEKTQKRTHTMRKKEKGEKTTEEIERKSGKTRKREAEWKSHLSSKVTPIDSRGGVSRANCCLVLICFQSSRERCKASHRPDVVFNCRFFFLVFYDFCRFDYFTRFLYFVFLNFDHRGFFFDDEVTPINRHRSLAAVFTVRRNKNKTTRQKKTNRKKGTRKCDEKKQWFEGKRENTVEFSSYKSMQLGKEKKRQNKEERGKIFSEYFTFLQCHPSLFLRCPVPRCLLRTREGEPASPSTRLLFFLFRLFPERWLHLPPEKYRNREIVNELDKL